MSKKQPIKNEDVINFLLKLVEEKSIDNNFFNENPPTIDKTTELLRSGIIDSFDLVEIITTAETQLKINPNFENTSLGNVNVYELAKAFDLK